MAINDDFRASVKERYGFESWPRAEAARPGALREFLPDVAARHPNLLLERRFPAGLDAFIEHHTDRNDPAVRIMITITRFPTPQDAREGLIDELGTVMAPRLPDCRDHGIGVGEVCFCGFEPADANIVFLRRNLVVRVNSIGDRRKSVTGIAETIDRQIMAARE
jgi:hypothetical protein